MDLTGMLNAPTQEYVNGQMRPAPAAAMDPAAARDKATILKLSAALCYIVANDNKNGGRRDAAGEQHSSLQLASTPTPQYRASYPAVAQLQLGHDIATSPQLWTPTFTLNVVNKNRGPDAGLSVNMTTREIIYRPDEPRVLLEDQYEIQGAHPRGMFIAISKVYQHNFVFHYPANNHWFDELSGLKKTAYIVMHTPEGEKWELHLKPSRSQSVPHDPRNDRSLFGYLCRSADIIHGVCASMEEMLRGRKLPLVLDLDDTLVRLVGDGDERHVPEREAHLYGNRVVTMKNGKRIVLTERVHEFLDWANRYFDISVCTLGEQNYMDNVIDVLDPDRVRFRGITYSARNEHEYIKRSHDPGRAPKDLMALYSYCALEENALGAGCSLPLIIDDETRMWPPEQHDNIIVVKRQNNNNLWNVSLFPVIQETLFYVHTEFYRQYDIWRSRQMMARDTTRQPPSVVAIYKAYLRGMLSDRIARSL